MPSDTDYVAESKKLTPATAGCYDCDWTTKESPCRGAMEKHREENPTHWVWQTATPNGLAMTDVAQNERMLDIE